MEPSKVKNEARVRAARSRWGGPHALRLDDFSSEERFALATLIRVFGQRAEKETTAEGQSPAVVKTIGGTGNVPTV